MFLIIQKQFIDRVLKRDSEFPDFSTQSDHVDLNWHLNDVSVFVFAVVDTRNDLLGAKLSALVGAMNCAEICSYLRVLRLGGSWLLNRLGAPSSSKS